LPPTTLYLLTTFHGYGWMIDCSFPSDFIIWPNLTWLSSTMKAEAEYSPSRYSYIIYCVKTPKITNWIFNATKTWEYSISAATNAERWAVTFFSSQSCPNSLLDISVSSTARCFRGVKATGNEADHSLSFSAEDNDGGAIPPPPPRVFIV
jgi:hypothetical protein